MSFLAVTERLKQLLRSISARMDAVERRLSKVNHIRQLPVIRGSIIKLTSDLTKTTSSTAVSASATVWTIASSGSTSVYVTTSETISVWAWMLNPGDVITEGSECMVMRIDTQQGGKWVVMNAECQCPTD